MGALRTTCMGLFETLFSSSTGDTVPQAQQPSQHEIFPEDKYNVAYAVAARHEEIRALEHLLEADQTSPTALEAEPFFQDIIEDMERIGNTLRLRTSGEELVDDIRELIEHWDNQVDEQIGTIWWPIGADTTFRLYLHYLELRADAGMTNFRSRSPLDRFTLSSSGVLVQWKMMTTRSSL